MASIQTESPVNSKNFTDHEIMVDRIFRTRSLGVAVSGLPDQYADGKAAKVWELYLGSKQERTSIYKEWFINLLKNHNVTNVLDVACGTGVDSVMLLEEGFNVISTDASDKMLKVALKERWNRRHEKYFDQWIIEEANWLTLPQDLNNLNNPKAIPVNGFDAVICLGNSFAHLPDLIGDQKEQEIALTNMRELLRTDGILVIDHRNYDYILETGQAPKGKNVYYPIKILIGQITIFIWAAAWLATLHGTLLGTREISSMRKFHFAALDYNACQQIEVL